MEKLREEFVSHEEIREAFERASAKRARERRIRGEWVIAIGAVVGTVSLLLIAFSN